VANNRSFLAERVVHGKPSFGIGTYEPDLIKDNMKEAVLHLNGHTPLKIVNAGFQNGLDASEAWEPWDVDQGNRAWSFLEEDQLSHGGANVAYHEQPGSTSEGGIFDSLLDDGVTDWASGSVAGEPNALQRERALANQEAGARLFDAGLDDETIASVLEDEEAQELFLRERELRQLSSETGSTATPDGAFDDEEGSVFQDIARRAFEYAADAAEYLSEQPEFLQNAMLHGLDLASGGIVKKALREGALRVAQSALDFDPAAEIARLADQLVAFVEGFSVEELKRENPQAFARAQMGAQVMLAVAFLPPRQTKKLLGRLTRRRRPQGTRIKAENHNGELGNRPQLSGGDDTVKFSTSDFSSAAERALVGGSVLTSTAGEYWSQRVKGEFDIGKLSIAAIQGLASGALKADNVTADVMKDMLIAMGGSLSKDAISEEITGDPGINMIVSSLGAAVGNGVTRWAIGRGLEPLAAQAMGEIANGYSAWFVENKVPPGYQFTKDEFTKIVSNIQDGFADAYDYVNDAIMDHIMRRGRR